MENLFNKAQAFLIFFFICSINHNIHMYIPIACMAEIYYFYAAFQRKFFQTFQHLGHLVPRNDDILVYLCWIYVIKSRRYCSSCCPQAVSCIFILCHLYLSTEIPANIDYLFCLFGYYSRMAIQFYEKDSLDIIRKPHGPKILNSPYSLMIHKFKCPRDYL